MHRYKKLTTVLLSATAIVLALSSCNQNAYVVLSDKVVMNTKDGMAYPLELDSTFQVYDHIKIKKSANGTVVKNMTASEREFDN